MAFQDRRYIFFLKQLIIFITTYNCVQGQRGLPGERGIEGEQGVEGLIGLTGLPGAPVSIIQTKLQFTYK